MLQSLFLADQGRRRLCLRTLAFVLMLGLATAMFSAANSAPPDLVIVASGEQGQSQPPSNKEQPKTEKKADAPKVTPIPEAIYVKFKLDREFYKKYVDYKGYTIVSSAKVSDAGLLEARYLIDKLLCEREDILKAMVKNGAHFMVMAPTEMTTDVPEQRYMKNDTKTNWDQRARGLGGKLTSCGEENLLNLKGDRYRSENILIHEFNHQVQSHGLRTVDPTFDRRLRATFDHAKSTGLWKGTYLMENSGEYWAEACQAYFDCMRSQFGANTREKLEKYDPDLFKLVDEVYKQSKYRYVRYDKRPHVAPAPVPTEPKKDKDKMSLRMEFFQPLADIALRPEK